MSLPMMGSDVNIGVYVEGIGLLTETVTEVEDFKFQVHMPIKERNVLGTDSVKLDQTYEKVTFSFKTFAKGPEALVLIERKMNAYFARRAQPNEALYVGERYRDSGGTRKTARMLNAKIEPGERSYPKRDEYVMQEWSGTAEIMRFV